MVGNDNRVSNYYTVSNGKIVRSFGGNEPEGIVTQSRVNKNGNTVYEQKFDFIKGKVIEAKLKTHDEYGDNIELTITDGVEVANLQMKFDSAYGRSFLNKIPNCNFDAILTISPYQFTDKNTGKNVLGLSILDPIEKVPNFYTKDNPNGIPQLEKIKLKGKDTWDNSKQLEFYKEKYAEFCTSLIEVKEPETESGEEEQEGLDF
jgi:hypothetical protein